MAHRDYYERPRGGRRQQQNRRKIILAAVILVIVLAAAAAYIWYLRRDSYQTGRLQAAEESTAADAYNTVSRPDPASAGGESDVYAEEEDDGLIWYDGKSYKYNGHLSNYLLMGVDTKGNINQERDWQNKGGGQADVIYLLSYDRKEESLRVFVLPRDTMTTVMVADTAGNIVLEEERQLCLQYAYGDGKRRSCEMMCDAVSYLLFGVPLSGYASINLDSLPVLSDVLGGVTVTLPDDSMTDVNPEWKKGTVITLDRNNSEKFLRYRNKQVELSAWARLNRQKVFVKAFAGQLRKRQKEDAGTVTHAFETLKPYMVTNMGNDIFLDLALAEQIGDNTTIPGEDVTTDNWDEFHVDQKALYGMIIEAFYTPAG